MIPKVGHWYGEVGAMKDAMLQVHIAFARLELLELESGRRTLLQCPGIEAVAKTIAEERAKLSPEFLHGQAHMQAIPQGNARWPEKK